MLTHTSTESITLSVGPFIDTLLQSFKDVITAPEATPKLGMYSAHDTCLIPLLIALGVFDGKWPPFSAAICMELWTTADHHRYVRVSYNGQYVVIAGQKTSWCPYDEFEALLRQYVPSDYKAMCVARESHQSDHIVTKTV